MQVLKASAVASIALFAWGFVFWWSPVPYLALDQIDEVNREEVVDYLQAQFPETGLFLIPDPNDPLEMLSGSRETGSAITIHVVGHEQRLAWGWILVAGILRLFFSLLLAGCLLVSVLPALRPIYLSRVKFVSLIGVLVIVYGDFADAVWWYYPWGFSLVKAAHDLIAWVLAGSILAAFIKETPSGTPIPWRL